MRRILVPVLGLALGACGAEPPPTIPGPPVANPFTFTITAGAGVTPKEWIVPPGTRVLFINTDTRRRNMTSDPHPEHTDCPEINRVGLLSSGQSKETENLVAVRTCGFHDHDDPGNMSVKGRIIIRP